MKCLNKEEKQLHYNVSWSISVSGSISIQFHFSTSCSRYYRISPDPVILRHLLSCLHYNVSGYRYITIPLVPAILKYPWIQLTNKISSCYLAIFLSYNISGFGYLTISLLSFILYYNISCSNYLEHLLYHIY